MSVLQLHQPSEHTASTAPSGTCPCTACSSGAWFIAGARLRFRKKCSNRPGTYPPARSGTISGAPYPGTSAPRSPAGPADPTPRLPPDRRRQENGGRWAPPARGGLGGGGRGGAARHGRQPSSAGRPQPEAGTSGRLRPPCPGAAGPSFPPGAAAAVLRGPAGRARPPRAGAGAAGRVGWRSASSRCILCRRPAPGSAAVGTFGTSLYRKGECLGAGSGAMPPLSGENWRTWRSLKRPWEQRHPLRERRSAGCPLTAGWLPSLLPSS